LTLSLVGGFLVVPLAHRASIGAGAKAGHVATAAALRCAAEAAALVNRGAAGVIVVVMPEAGHLAALRFGYGRAGNVERVKGALVRGVVAKICDEQLQRLVQFRRGGYEGGVM
jgi:hypothetical protein